MGRLNRIVKKGFLFLTAFMFTLQGALAQAGGHADVQVDQARKGTITIQKNLPVYQEGEPPQTLSGVRYRVTYQRRLDFSMVQKEDADFYSEEKETKDDGTVTFRDLPLGDYLVEETGGTPEGYMPAPAAEVCIPAANTAEMTVDGITYPPGTLWMYEILVLPKTEEILGAVRLLKEDEETAERLQGAYFRLFKENGEAYVTASGKKVCLSTDTDGCLEVTHLPYGSYYFEETKAPEGYQLSGGRYYFEITENYREEDGKGVTELTVTNRRIERGTEPDSSDGGQGGFYDRREPSARRSTKTGDETAFFPWMCVMAGALLLMVVNRKRK